MIHDTNMPVPDVSVVIPTYNRISMLEDAIASIFKQTFIGGIEIIVVDDCSSDNTPQIVREKYPTVQLIVLSQNSGPSAARNKGIAAARGRYTAFLDSDDLWEPDYLRSQVSTLEKKSEENAPFFCVSGIFIWDTARSRKSYRSQGPYPEYSSPIHHLLSAGSFIHMPSSALFPRDIFTKVGLFDESLRFGEDTDLYIRMLLAGYQPVFNKKPLAVRRKHGQGQAIEFKNMDLRIQNRLKTVEKYYSLLGRDNVHVSAQQIKAEIYAHFATQCYRSKHFLKWLALSQASIKYTSWRSVISRMISHDLASTTSRISVFLEEQRPI